MSRYLDIKRLEFVITYLCNSKCKHCQIDEAHAAKFPNHIHKNLAVEIVRRVGEKYKPKSVMTFGGEPLLFPEIVRAVHEEAKEIGIPVREIITNGFWSTKTERIRAIVNNLVKSGVNEVSISVDCFHQEFIPLDIVRKTAEELLEAGSTEISWNPCWVESRDHDNPYNLKTKAILDELEDLPIRCSEGNDAQPEGRATLWLKDFIPTKTRTPKGRCGDLPYTEKLDSVKAICVEPDGKIAICKEFYIGNASETDIIDITENYDPFKIPEARALITNGIEGLQSWAKTKGVEPNPEGYYNICHMCADIRKRTNKSMH